MRASCVESHTERKGIHRRTVAGGDTYTQAHTHTHTRSLAHSNDTLKHSHELTFPDNDFEIAFHIAVGKIRHRDTAVHHKCYGATACKGKMHGGKVQIASANRIRGN